MSKLWFLIIGMILIVGVFAWTPPGNIDLKNFFKIINATNVTAENYLNNSGDLEWIRPEHIFDVDDADIETDLNTYWDIAGDSDSGEYNFSFPNSNMTMKNYFGSGKYLTDIQHGQLTLYMHNETSGVSGSKILSLRQNDTELVTLSTLVASDDQEIQNWTTEEFIPRIDIIPDGTVHYNLRARVTAVGTKDLRLYFKFYHANSSGGDMNLISTSETTSVLTNSMSPYNIYCAHNETDIELTDRLHIELLAGLSGSGANPTLEVEIEGGSVSRIEVPSPSPSRELFIPWTDWPYNADAGNKNFTTADSIKLTNGTTTWRNYVNANGTLIWEVS